MLCSMQISCLLLYNIKEPTTREIKMKEGDLVRHRYLVKKYGLGIVIGGKGKYRMVYWPCIKHPNTQQPKYRPVLKSNLVSLS